MPKRGRAFSRAARPGDGAVHVPIRRASALNAKGDWSAMPCVSICTRRGVSTRIVVRPLPPDGQEYCTVASWPSSAITKRLHTLFGCRNCSRTLGSDMQRVRLASGLSRDRMSHRPGCTERSALIGRKGAVGAASPGPVGVMASVPVANAAASQIFAFKLLPPEIRTELQRKLRLQYGNVLEKYHALDDARVKGLRLR